MRFLSKLWASVLAQDWQQMFIIQQKKKKDPLPPVSIQV